VGYLNGERGLEELADLPENRNITPDYLTNFDPPLSEPEFDELGDNRT